MGSLSDPQVVAHLQVCCCVDSWRNACRAARQIAHPSSRLVSSRLKALREQLKENDQLHSVEENVGPVPEIPIEYDQILKEGGRFWDDVNGGYLPEDLVLAARREEIDSVHSEGVFEIVSMQECRDAEHGTIGPDLDGHRQVCGSDTREYSIEVVCRRIQNEEAR